jgi:hypothetical protein
MNEEENEDNMIHSHIEHSDPKEKEEQKKQYEKDLGTVKVTEHPELSWWCRAITVCAHNQNRWKK